MKERKITEVLNEINWDRFNPNLPKLEQALKGSEHVYQELYNAIKSAQKDKEISNPGLRDAYEILEDLSSCNVRLRRLIQSEVGMRSWAKKGGSRDD